MPHRARESTPVSTIQRIHEGCNENDQVNGVFANHKWIKVEEDNSSKRRSSLRLQRTFAQLDISYRHRYHRRADAVNIGGAQVNEVASAFE